SWTAKVAHPSEVCKKGEEIRCVVLGVDQERKRIGLGLKQLQGDPWEGDIPSRYHAGQILAGKVTKLTNFGVFVELEPGLEGLLHVSELSDEKVESPETVLKVGDEVQVKVLRVEAAERKIGLGRRRVQWRAEQEAEALRLEQEEAARKAAEAARPPLDAEVEAWFAGGTGEELAGRLREAGLPALASLVS